MIRYAFRVLACILLVGGSLNAQQDEAEKAKGLGIAVCVGIDRYPLLGDRTGCRAEAQAVGSALKAGGYDSVVVLVDGTKDWESRATLSNIRSQLTQAADLARPQDRIVFFFSGRVISAAGEASLVPVHGDEDNAIPFSWVCETLAAGKAGSRLIVIDGVGDGGDLARGLDKANGAKSLAVLLSGGPGEPSQMDKDSGRSVFARALLEVLAAKGDAGAEKSVTLGEIFSRVSDAVRASSARSGQKQSPRMLGDSGTSILVRTKLPVLKRGDGRLRFVMHRKLSLKVEGSSRELWKFDDRTIDFTYRFNADTHETVHIAELPAGEYSVSQEKWEHNTNLGIYTGGPYAPLAVKLRIVPGSTHELKSFNQQFPLSPHGTGVVFWEGKRLCRVNSLTKQVWTDKEIDEEDAKGAMGVPVRTALLTGNSQRKAKLGVLASRQFTQALRAARETGNRVLIAEAADGMARLLATASDDSVRNGRRALVLAEEAVELGSEMQADSLWSYRDTLAAALAENGKFDEAVRQATEARAQAQKQPAAASAISELDARLKLYQAKQPCRE
jgi:hypothetical protein